MRIATWNVNSVNARLERVLGWFEAVAPDVAVLQVLHRDELTFPFAGWTRFEGLERSEETIADPAHLRAAYLQALEAWRSELAEGCRRQRIDLAMLPNDEPCGRQLASWLGTRAAA